MHSQGVGHRADLREVGPGRGTPGPMTGTGPTPRSEETKLTVCFRPKYQRTSGFLEELGWPHHAVPILYTPPLLHPEAEISKPTGWGVRKLRGLPAEDVPGLDT